MVYRVSMTANLEGCCSSVAFYFVARRGEMKSLGFYLILIQLVFAGPVIAADSDNKGADDLLRPGVAASTQRFSRAGAVDMSETPVIEMSGSKKEQESLEGLNPVIGRVTRIKGSRCLAELSNSSSDDYSVRYQILTEGRDGRVARKESFSASLSAKKSVSKSFLCDRDQNLRIILVSGKRRGKQPVKKANTVAAAEDVGSSPEAEPESAGLRLFEPFSR